MNNIKRKTNPTKVNLFLDVAIFAAFLLALDPRLTGIAIHEWLGVAGTAAVVVHLLLHWEWIVGVTRRFLGRTSGAARLNYVVDALFFIDLVVISLSGLMVSQALLPCWAWPRRAGRSGWWPIRCRPTWLCCWWPSMLRCTGSGSSMPSGATCCGPWQLAASGWR
jgi:hypothetical protein